MSFEENEKKEEEFKELKEKQKKDNIYQRGKKWDNLRFLFHYFKWKGHKNLNRN